MNNRDPQSNNLKTRVLANEEDKLDASSNASSSDVNTGSSTDTYITPNALSGSDYLKQDSPLANTLYFGVMSAAGGDDFGTSSFTHAKVSTGRYRITHNNGNANYVAFAIADDTTGDYTVTYDPTGNYVDFYLRDGGTLTDTKFAYMIVLRP